MRVRVTRALQLGGKAQEPGSEIDVASNFAAELVAINKAVHVRTPVATTMTTESAGDLVNGKRKGKSDAG